MTIVVGLLLVLIVGGMIGIPLLQSETAEAGESDYAEPAETVQDPDEASRDAVFKELNEIEFDYRMKKLSDEDYSLLKDRYTRMAVSILKKEEEVEKTAMDEVEREIEAELEAGFCIHCGATLKGAGQAFCHQCGEKL